MNLLMPELERQLREAVRSGRAREEGGAGVGGEVEVGPPGERGGGGVEVGPPGERGARGARGQRSARRQRSRRPLPSLLPGAGGALIAGATTVAVAIAVLAVVVIGHGGGSRRPADSGRGPLVAPQGCARLAPKGPTTTIASGSLDGHPWGLTETTRAAAADPIAARSFVLGGHRYAVCPNAIELVDVAPHGIVYGFIVGSGPYSVRLSHLPGAGVASTQQIPGGTFFAEALPGSACQYHSFLIWIGSARAGRVESVQFGSSCRPEQIRPLPESAPLALPVSPPTGLSREQRSKFLAGEVAVDQTGCLACHRIGDVGSRSPGQDLTGIGRRLSSVALERALQRSPAPKPTYYSLPRRQLQALAYFLSRLRSRG